MFEVLDLDGSMLKEACNHAKHSAGGLDSLTFVDFTLLLLDEMYHWLARPLNLLEEGASWPDDLLQAKATYLSKDPGKLEDPMAYRSF